MAQRAVPPLPSKKPPVPLSFKFKQLLNGNSMLPIPPLSFSGGAATAAGGAARGDSGASNMGMTGNIGALSFSPNYKGKDPMATYIFLGAAVFIGYMIVKRVF